MDTYPIDPLLEYRDHLEDRAHQPPVLRSWIDKGRQAAKVEKCRTRGCVRLTVREYCTDCTKAVAQGVNDDAGI